MSLYPKTRKRELTNSDRRLVQQFLPKCFGFKSEVANTVNKQGWISDKQREILTKPIALRHDITRDVEVILKTCETRGDKYAREVVKTVRRLGYYTDSQMNVLTKSNNSVTMKMPFGGRDVFTGRGIRGNAISLEDQYYEKDMASYYDPDFIDYGLDIGDYGD